MQAKVAKQFTFHAAHRLPHHDGQCQRLHGHSYVLEVAVTGAVRAAPGESDEGMVLDFTILKDIYKMEIEPFVEHQNLMETLAKEHADYPYWTECKNRGGPGGQSATERVPLTTCECLAGWMHTVVYNRLRDVPGPSDYKVKIKLWETPTSFAVVGG